MTFEVSADSKTLSSVLREAEVGATVTYAALSAAIGRNVQDVARGAMRRARSIVMREDRMVFAASVGVGLTRLADEQIVSLSDKARAHIRRTTRKTAKALTCVQYDAMSREQQTKHNTALSMLGVIGELATEKASKRLNDSVSAAGTEIPAAKAAIAALGWMS